MRVMRSAVVIAGVVFFGSSLSGSCCFGCCANAVVLANSTVAETRVRIIGRVTRGWRTVGGDRSWLNRTGKSCAKFLARVRLVGRMVLASPHSALHCERPATRTECGGRQG